MLATFNMSNIPEDPKSSNRTVVRDPNLATSEPVNLSNCFRYGIHPSVFTTYSI
jgi:hypothetical protein